MKKSFLLWGQWIGLVNLVNISENVSKVLLFAVLFVHENSLKLRDFHGIESTYCQ